MSHQSARVWSLAESRNESTGQAIIFRYVDEFAPDFSRSSLPVRVFLVWRYESDSGMPASDERQRMDLMEDALEPVVEASGVAILAIVLTGDGVREWTYYARSEHEFLARLNQALSGQAAFPIEIHVNDDPEWSAYDDFRSGWLIPGKEPS